MLNELFAAGRSLADAGIQPQDWHPSYTPIPKSAKGASGKLAFYVFLGRDGVIARTERITEPTETEGLRKWETSNGYSFPYFNVPPLWWIDFKPSGSGKIVEDEDFKRKLDRGTLSPAVIRRFIRLKTKAESVKGWDENQIKRVTDCLQKLPKQLATILGVPPQDIECIAALIERSTTLDGLRFYRSLKASCLRQVRMSPSSLPQYFGALFHFGETKPQNNISILLELIDAGTAFQYPVKNQKVGEWINKRLLADDDLIGTNDAMVDAFGVNSAGATETFPDVTASILGKVILRAMNHESQCQYRYGTIKEASCPVGAGSRRTMKSALEWLTDPSRKNLTWVPADQGELLLAYPSVLPPDPPGLASFFGGVSDKNTAEPARFENCAQDVVGTLQGLVAKDSNLDIRVIVLRKMDKARTRVSAQRRYLATHLIQAAKVWQQGCENVPRILIREFVAKAKAEWRESPTPFPLEVARVLNAVWSRDREKVAASAISSFDTNDAICLLLDDGPFLQMVARRGVYAATHGLLGLILALGHAHAQGNVAEIDSGQRRHASLLPSILGLLLFKLDIRKENYMTASPYLVGRLLSLADQLHYHYCQHVRKGQVPPQLMGNALMTTALEEPKKALALYSNRILPYQAWARTSSGDEAALARYFLGELGNVCSEMEQAALPDRCADSDKAQMLIGYLARPAKSESGTTDRGNVT